jgi:hypothetical protein
VALHLAQNHFTAWLYPALLSLTLAKPWHNTHPLPALRSFALAAHACIQTREMLLFLSRPLMFLFDWHLLACLKGDILRTSNPESIVPKDHATKAHGSYTLGMCTT